MGFLRDITHNKPEIDIRQLASCDRTSASLATRQICLILLLVLHVSVMYLFVFGE